jgi:maltose alpha-D-glucosyltransferase/alpha-amylase
MNFHFPLMPRMYMAVAREDRQPVVDILERTPEIPDTCQWATFLRNHDELTLEMVTDDERALVYSIFAPSERDRLNLGIRRRLAPLLQNDRRRLELMNGLLLSMPGTPVIYYGDEIGMGDNVWLDDRYGVRTPMQWSCDRNAGFSKASPQRLYLPVVTEPEYHYAAVNVEAQERNPTSLLSWFKRTIALRKQHRAFGRGNFTWVPTENRSIMAFVRGFYDDRVLVVANLAGSAQYAQLDLSEWAGSTPVELFGQSVFPVVDEEPYPFTLAPYALHWFAL